MKKAGFFLAAAFCIALMSTKASAQVPITYYDFENNTTRTAFETTVEQQINSGNSVFARVGLNNVITGNTGAAATLYAGATTGSAINSTTWPSGSTDPGTGATNYYQFTVNTSGFTGASLSFDVFAGTTPSSYPFVGALISTNGTGGPFSQLIAGFDPALSTWSTRSVNLPAAADNNSNVVIRIYGYFSDNSVNGTLRLDNVTIFATAATSGSKTLLNEIALYTSLTSGGTGSLFIRNNFTVNGASVTTFANGPTTFAVAFSGTLSVTSGTFILAGSLFESGASSATTVSSGATLSCGTSANIISGAGAFTLSSGANFQISDPNGITSSTTASGNVQVTGTRTYNGGANYSYIRNATGTQSTGNGLPATITGSLMVALGASADAPLTLTQATTVSSLTLTSGTLSNASSTLTLANGATITRSGGSLSNTPTFGTSVNVTYTGAVTTGPELPTSSTALNNLAVNVSGGTVTLAASSNPTVNGTLTITAGTLATGANTLTLNSGVSNSGTLSGGTGTVTLGGNSTRSLAGSGAYNFNNLTVNASGGTINLPSNTTIHVAGNFTKTAGSFTCNSSSSQTSNTCTLDFNGGATSTFSWTTASTLPWNITVQSGTTVNLGATNSSFTLRGDLGGSGTWSATGGTLTIDTVTTSNITGTKTFNNLTLNTSATLAASTSVTVASTLTLGSGTLTINSNTLNINSGGSISATSGGLASGSAGGTVAFLGTGTVSGTLTFNNVTLSGAVNFGTGSTIGSSGSLTRFSSGSVNTNPPTYATGSTLIYDLGTVGFVARGLEWNATSGAGYPYNVQINNLSSINLGSGGANTARQIAGSLTINNGGELSMAATPMTAALTVLGNVAINNGGTLTLSSASGGDLHLQGNYTKSGTLASNNRTVFFEGSGTQTITDGSGTATLPYVTVNKGGGMVQLISNLTTLAPAGGNSLTFTGSTSTLTLNGKTLTLGGLVPAISAGSGFIGSSTSSMSLQDGGQTGAMGTLVFTSGNESLQNLTINRTGGTGSATLGSNVSVAGTLTLTSGIINTGSNTLALGGSATATGASTSSYVLGNLKKTFSDALPFTFGVGDGGYSPVTIDVPGLMSSTDITVNARHAFQPTVGNNLHSLQRYWTVTGSGVTANLLFNYLDGDVPGTANESLFQVVKVNGSNVSFPPGGVVSAGSNQATITTGSFSDWTLSEPSVPTAVDLIDFGAVKDDNGNVYLQWKTGYEVRNLGFNLYREVGGQRTRLNPSPIAGSALLGRAGTAFTAGFSYAWMDAPAAGVGKAATTYLLEDIDFNGKRVMHGPISPIPGGKLPAQAQALLLSQLQTNAPATTEQRQFLPGSASAVTKPVNNPGKGFGKGAPLSAGLQTQWDIASQPGVKLLINKTGWYRVTQSELVAAGFDVTREPFFLQLYLDGEEIPFRVNGGNTGRLAAGDSIEFYAKAIDTTYTNQRAYYLINGAQAGRRIPVVNGDGGDESRAASFDTTVERRDRSIYFAGLKNGETENWFGAIITGTPVSQTLKVAHLDADSAREATLEIALQGVFDDENVWPDHAVKVLLNGEDVGTMSFDGRQRPISQFTLSGKLLQEGDNTVTLQSLNGSMDINLIDYVRLTYAHRFEADNNALLYTANGRELVQISGFSTANVRVYDLTDPGNITELQGNVQPSGKTYRVTVAAPDAGPRILYAVGEKALQPVAAAVANQPSSWNKLTQGADVLIITHKDFLSTVAPLKALRQSQGYGVSVVDVEDLFDEFSFGQKTPQAVKDFLTRAAAWKKVPRYAVLVGDASYDPKNYLGLGANDFVPTRMIDTLEMEAASDDSLGDMDDDDVSEIAIGRLPVRTATEAALTIQKIIRYEQEGRPEGALLVSDRNDGYDFEGTNAGVKSLLPGGMTVGEVKRSQMTDPGAHQAIVDWISRGPKVVNYAGHGSFGLWRGNLLLNADTAQMRNGANLPFVITMTCLNGQYNTPYGDSLAEALVKADGGGAVAVWASSSLTAANSQPDMDQELIRQLFTGFSATGNRLTFGEAVRRAKLMTVDSDIRRSWILFGDPTTRLK